MGAKKFTEDDTFRALKRVPFNVARQTVRRLHTESSKGNIVIKELSKLGWTASEYRQAHRVHINREVHDQ